jgi:hypothetical protein
MGQLAVGLLGGAIGGSPGYLAGMFIGGLLFPPEGQDTHTQGARREDFKISSSTRGRPRKHHLAIRWWQGWSAKFYFKPHVMDLPR